MSPWRDQLHGPPALQVAFCVAPLRKSSSTGARKACNRVVKSPAGVAGTSRPARRAKARTCAGRDGFSQEDGVSPSGTWPTPIASRSMPLASKTMASGGTAGPRIGKMSFRIASGALSPLRKKSRSQRGRPCRSYDRIQIGLHDARDPANARAPRQLVGAAAVLPAEVA